MNMMRRVLHVLLALTLTVLPCRSRGEGDTVELDLGRPTAINHAISMEDIREGQRVRAYRLEGFAGGTWTTLVPDGRSIGHKQIDVFPRTEVTRVRLVVTESAAKPLIRRLAIFDVEGAGTGPCPGEVLVHPR